METPDPPISSAYDSDPDIDELEREEVMADYTAKIVDSVLALPPCQRHALICSLKEQIDNILPLIEAFRSRGVNIEEVILPKEQKEVLSSRVSLSLARKKLRSLKKITE